MLGAEVRRSEHRAFAPLPNTCREFCAGIPFPTTAVWTMDKTIRDFAQDLATARQQRQQALAVASADLFLHLGHESDIAKALLRDEGIQRVQGGGHRAIVPTADSRCHKEAYDNLAHCAKSA